MDSTTVRLVLDELELLAQKIGVAAEKLFPYFVKQVYLDFVIAGALTVFGWTVFVIFYRIGSKIWRESSRSSYDERPVLIGTGLTAWGIACIAATVATIILGCHLLNVEYWAIQKILMSF